MAKMAIEQIEEILDFAKGASFAGHFAEAEELFAKASSLLKGADASGKIMFEFHAQRGFNYELLNDDQMACAEFKAALQISENAECDIEALTEVFMVYGRCSKRLKDYDNALKSFESALRIYEYHCGSDDVKTRLARSSMLGIFMRTGDEMNREKFSRMEQSATGSSLMPPDLALQKLHSLGMMSEFDLNKLKSTVERLFGSEVFLGEVSTLDLMRDYYESDEFGSERAAKDGWISCSQDYRTKSDDIVAEFCAVVGGEPILRFVKYAGPNIYVDRNPKTQMKWAAENVDDIARMFNSRLYKLKREERFHAVDTGDDIGIFLLLTPAVKRELNRVVEFRSLGEAKVL